MTSAAVLLASPISSGINCPSLAEFMGRVTGQRLMALPLGVGQPDVRSSAPAARDRSIDSTSGFPKIPAPPKVAFTITGTRRIMSPPNPV